jgi:hypothetical protein
MTGDARRLHQGREEPATQTPAPVRCSNVDRDFDGGIVGGSVRPRAQRCPTDHHASLLPDKDRMPVGVAAQPLQPVGDRAGLGVEGADGPEHRVVVDLGDRLDVRLGGRPDPEVGHRTSPPVGQTQEGPNRWRSGPDGSRSDTRPDGSKPQSPRRVALGEGLPFARGGGAQLAPGRPDALAGVDPPGRLPREPDHRRGRWILRARRAAGPSGVRARHGAGRLPDGARAGKVSRRTVRPGDSMDRPRPHGGGAARPVRRLARPGHVPLPDRGRRPGRVRRAGPASDPPRGSPRRGNVRSRWSSEVQRPRCRSVRRSRPRRRLLAGVRAAPGGPGIPSNSVGDPTIVRLRRVRAGRVLAVASRPHRDASSCGNRRSKDRRGPSEANVSLPALRPGSESR